MVVSFHAKGSAPSRDHHTCCDITFLHTKENYYQSIKSNQIRNYSHQEVMMAIMAISFHAKGGAPSRDHHACCDITFLHAKGNYYQSIKSNQIRNYSHQEVMIFLHAKQPNMIIYHVAVAVDPCGGSRAAG